MNYLKRTWCEINLDHLQYNLKELSRIAEKELIAVVKADAYGHGDKRISVAAEKAGVNRFAVSNLNEALNLRHAGVTGEILILGYTPEEMVSVLQEYQITQTIHSLDYAKKLNDAVDVGAVKVHIKVDTGMNRIGFPQNEFHDSFAEILEVSQLPGLNCCGIFTHFSCADSFDEEDIGYTEAQMAYLDDLLERLEAEGVCFEAAHAQNSAGTINYKNEHYNCARVGISMYGLDPSGEMKGKAEMKPVLEWKAVVSLVKEIPAGSQVSYGRTFVADTDKKVATLAIGYADGYYRSFSSRADVLINGVRCPVLGRVCMDQMVVDVTNAGEVQMGDVATIIGRDGKEEITADELAALADTINYEVVCSISRRVPRVYFQNGEQVDAVDYSLG